MKKYILIIFIIVVHQRGFAQKIGIKFEQELNWTEIKKKAKLENKYIFLDGYTTWCAPCKKMALEVFSLKEVADYFNKNFINVAVQFDISKNDSHNVKQWYKDAAELHKYYNVVSYPTYLFFNPDGNLVYKIIGADFSADKFLERAKIVFTPKSQYPYLKEKFEKGARDTALLSSLIAGAIDYGDFQKMPLYVNYYLRTQTDLTSRKNLLYAYYGTQNTSDEGFQIIQKFPLQMDSLIGLDFSRKIINMLIYEEVVFPLLKINGTIKQKNGMTEYSGATVLNVDWEKVKSRLEQEYPRYAEGVLRYSETTFYGEANNWPKFVDVVNQYIGSEKIDRLDVAEIDSYSKVVFQSCEDFTYLKQALNWSDKITESTNNVDHPTYVITKANLLYKINRKEEAITLLENLLKVTNTNFSEYINSILTKMRKG
ncbi:DUF255 domain-containing protein [Pedobacter changchengzhani]|uniref:DUF255 domain-containing protein n=1 Tax=Pedobacter changchengzhani TaxID=2529274 RepID=A0A4R5MH54_9SPHI|nr:thioredoxin fold domain-containing protein [Pedobacter changchengzhani]TDG34838.1 DUF255 domain-containing protein [Pedobacter changchengzhani]